MPDFVQHNPDGSISAHVNGTRAPLHPRQIAFQDPPPEPTPPDTTIWLEGHLPADIHGHRVDLSDPKKPKLVKCHVVAAHRHNGQLDHQLNVLAGLTIHALRRHAITGDKAELEGLEDEAKKLEAARKPIPDPNG